jgi:transposase
VLGIDDFAMRRGDSYGTILINVKTGKPLDLLPDRTAEAVMPWLSTHPEIQVVSRDRPSAYADAVSRVLPHATQGASRYHLIQNLREHLQRFLDRKRSYLSLVEQSPLTEVLPTVAASGGSLDDQTSALASRARVSSGEAEGTPEREAPGQPEARDCLMEQEAHLSSLTYDQRKKKISREKRLARYEQVLALHRAGMGQRAIARELEMSRQVVHRFLAAETFPERAPGSGVRRRGVGKLDPYLAYLREQWDAGTHNSSHLEASIKQRGYSGSPALLRRLLGEWRAELPSKPRQGKPRKPRLASPVSTQAGKHRLSSRSAAFLMIRPPEKLSERQRHQLEHICQGSSELRTVYLLSQEFVTMLKERQAEALDSWLNRAKACHVTELTSFVNGIRRDYAAVYAAFSRSESNGITEGHVNRLKFLKRQMFGRARLDLLRVKVLHAL